MHALGPAQPSGALGHRAEHRVRIGGGAAEGDQHVVRGGQLLDDHVAIAPQDSAIVDARLASGFRSSARLSPMPAPNVCATATFCSRPAGGGNDVDPADPPVRTATVFRPTAGALIVGRVTGMQSVDPTTLLLQLSILLAGAYLLGRLAERIGLPSTTGELATGLVLGPSLLGGLADRGRRPLAVRAGGRPDRVPPRRSPCSAACC